MKIETTYAEVQARYPALVAQIVADHQAGKGKYRNTLPKDMKWTLEWAVNCESIDIKKVLKGKLPKGPSNKFNTRLADELSRILPWLCGSTKGARRTAKLEEIPQEIAQKTEDSVRKELAEESRIAKMSPQQRDTEIQDLLGQLSKSPGFMMFQIKKGK